MNFLDLLKTDMVKTLATIFLFCVVMAALVLYIIDTVKGIPVPQSVSDVLIAAITACLPIVGLHQGVSIANGVAKDTAVAVLHEQNSAPLPTVNQEVK